MKIPKILSELAHPTASTDSAVQRERFSIVESLSKAGQHGIGLLNKWNMLAKTMSTVSGHDVKQIKPKDAKQVENNPLIPPKHKKH